ncbi:MAG TPA: hypothetical protein VET88_02555 [Gammaproteobacteria bacterium]|nr:hypothetical protein [Gammaproteobacteria bacterium]
MANEITGNEPGDVSSSNQCVADEAVADPVAVVLMLQQENGNRGQKDSRVNRPLLKHAEIKEKVLRRILEESLDQAVSPTRPSLKIVK